jgi:capsular exopolysaccharide synthesis family protein
MDSDNSQSPGVPISAGLGIKLYRYRSLIRRHWWVLLVTIGLGLAYEGYVLFSKPRLFESSSMLMVREEFITNASRDAGVFQDRQDNLFGTAVEQLRSAPILEKARSSLALEAPHLSGRVEITPSITPRTSIFAVKGVGENPEYTQRFVDAVVSEFLVNRQVVRDDTVSKVKVGLTGEVNQLRAEFEQQQNRFQTFISENNMPFWQEQGKSAAMFLSGLKNQEAQLLNELQRLQNLTPDELLQTPAVNTPSSKAPPGVSGNASRQEAPFNNESLVHYNRVMQELVQKQAEVEQWKPIWKPKHPKMQVLQGQVESLQRLLEVIKTQNKDAIKARIAAINAELKSLESSIGIWEKKVLEASRKDAEYQRLQRDVSSTEATLARLQQGTRDLGPVKTVTPDPFVVTQKATAPSPVPAGAVKHLLIGLIGGFIVGMIILVVLDRADDRLASSTEMLDHFSEPILGQIPNVAESRKESGLPLLQLEDERYTYAEAFRSLRSSLIFMPNQAEMKTILITSAIPNEGKSTIASNLALTMAASGARVLLVDADLRRGDIAQLFDIDGRIGLSDILRGKVHWKETVQRSRPATLSIIPCGPATNQSGELLLKPELMNLLDEFKEVYDLIIFNTAPILAADDTPTLAPNFDGVLMVVRAQFTSARLSKNALNTLYQRQVNVLGLILNCIDTEMPDYYYYRYPKYYAAS